ncbi:hypothetical protein M422DRAFT_39303 [Sphaerobolus stellatus SS14]|uniref:Uncharacterized protein n=1 Tax=Sphaerobolus stellatus (strain SS14) TaxID=990650 RepID=A0A0C9UFT2_SPHS4|nr:hypothetical protein M422DRAFT_39303 [Sphaerobolus stellatus SS14]
MHNSMELVWLLTTSKETLSLITWKGNILTFPEVMEFDPQQHVQLFCDNIVPEITTSPSTDQLGT